MKFFFSLFIFLFLLIGNSKSNESIRFININYIVNNSHAGVALNKMIEDKDKKIETELRNLAKKLEEKKNKIISQKNILKKEEFDKLASSYDKELRNFNELRNKKKADFNNFSVKSKKKNYRFTQSNNNKFFTKRVYKNFTSKRKNYFWR